MAGRADARRSDVWTLPNAVSALRLLGVPLFLWLVLGPGGRRPRLWSC